MKSQSLADLFTVLGVARSFSRSRVSDDNAFSEAQFNTLKYQPDYPREFSSPAHARAYAQEVVAARRRRLVLWNSCIAQRSAARVLGEVGARRRAHVDQRAVDAGTLGEADR